MKEQKKYKKYYIDNKDIKFFIVDEDDLISYCGGKHKDDWRHTKLCQKRSIIGGEAVISFNDYLTQKNGYKGVYTKLNYKITDIENFKPIRND